jgi:hypothetical protein
MAPCPGATLSTKRWNFYNLVEVAWLDGAGSSRPASAGTFVTTIPTAGDGVGDGDQFPQVPADDVLGQAQFGGHTFIADHAQAFT